MDAGGVFTAFFLGIYLHSITRYRETRLYSADGRFFQVEFYII